MQMDLGSGNQREFIVLELYLLRITLAHPFLYSQLYRAKT